MTSSSLVSVHGGHSGQFCNHASDALEDIIKLYVEKNYQWVAITEHAPAINDKLMHADEKQAGLTPEILLRQFESYMVECRRLQEKFSSKIKIFAAIEIETYSGYKEFVPFLINKFQPDYIVGSVHFVNDIGFDYSREQYDRAVAAAGGKNNLYCQYFDQQFEMIEFLQPAVVGHFDLIRIHDQDYKKRLLNPPIMSRIKRNLQLIKDLDLIMDLNLRSLMKGADEPYISRVILEIARDMEIAVVPGDDSHGLDSVGAGMDTGVRILEILGFSKNWSQPKVLNY